MTEETMTDAEVATMPLDERIQIALAEAIGEDDAAHAFAAIKPLLKATWSDGHYCGVICEREDVARCHRNPFALLVPSAKDGE